MKENISVLEKVRDELEEILDDDDAFISSMAGDKIVDIQNFIQDEIEKLKKDDSYSVAGTYFLNLIKN